MSRFALVFGVGLCAALAPAAPVPKTVAEKERFAALWGETAGAGEVVFQGRQVTIRNAPVVPDTSALDRPSSIPHTGRNVCGDFVATVLVVEASAPRVADDHLDFNTHAGLYVSGDGSGATYHRIVGLTRAGGELKPSFGIGRALWLPNERSAGGGIGENGGAVRLRIERRAHVVTASYSTEGAKWSEPFPLSDKLNLPNEVTVGVFAGTLAPRTASATFADLTIEPLKAEPKK